MQIGWLKTLDTLLAGIPTNSQQRLEIQKLKAYISDLESKLRTATAQLEALRPKADMDVDAVRILQRLFREDRTLSPESFVEDFGLTLGMARHHFDVLMEKGLIKHGPIDDDESDGSHEITPAGRAYVVRHGMD